MNDVVKIIIAEDEALQRSAFVKQLQIAWPEARIVAECADGESAVNAVEGLQPQVAFLDIRMPKLNGLEVAKAIAERAFVVFTTAYDEYAIDAFESGAVDYLLKPIDALRLAETIDRLKGRIADQRPQNLDSLIQQLQTRLQPKPAALQWVTASSGDTTRMISIDDVLYFKSEHKHTKVVTQEHEAIIRTSLKELRERLDQEQFWQVHRGAIVAVSAIESLKKDELGGHYLSLKEHPDRVVVNKEFHRKFKAL